MDKRYQVFVSSTYSDLKDERQSVIQTLMEMDCIPAGMELFPATDDEQWQFIQKIIDDCDYYLLIIGGRYGSLSNDGISYTEKEYDYAVSKGMKVVAFIHESPEAIPVGKSENEPALKDSLSAFKKKVSTGRLIRYWNHAKDLPGLVALNMTKTIKTHPATGWIRADRISNESALSELNELRKRNEELSQKIKKLETTSVDISSLEGIASFDSDYTINYELYGYDYDYETNKIYRKNILFTWREIFSLLSPYLTKSLDEARVEELLEKEIRKKSECDDGTLAIDNQNIQTISIQFKTLGLIKTNSLNWELTEKGERVMFELRAIR